MRVSALMAEHTTYIDFAFLKAKQALVNMLRLSLETARTKQHMSCKMV